MIYKKTNLLLLKYPFLHLFILFIGMIILRIFFISSIAYCAYPFDTWNSVYAIDNPDIYVFKTNNTDVHVDQPNNKEKLTILQKQRLTNNLFQFAKIKPNTHETVLIKELENPSYIANCPLPLQKVIQDILPLYSTELTLKKPLVYTDSVVMAVNNILTDAQIPLNDGHISALLKHLVKQTEHPLIFHLHNLYHLNTFLEGEFNYLGRTYNIQQIIQQYTAIQSDTLKLCKSAQT